MNRAAQAEKLAKLGWPSRLIAKEMGLQAGSVSHTLSLARREGITFPKATGFNQDGTIPLSVRGDLLEKTLAYSKVCEVSPLDLANAVLEYALSDPAVVLHSILQARAAGRFDTEDRT